MTPTRILAALALSALSAIFTATSADAQTAPVKAKNVVLIHGAWADGSSWGEVIPLLQKAGLHVTAVQDPLSSLADSNAAAKRTLALQDGPTVLVGHSGAAPSSATSAPIPRSLRSFMSLRARLMPMKISSRCPANSPLARSTPAFRPMTATRCCPNQLF